MTESISFDRAAEYYDQTRGLPDRLMAELMPRLVAALPRHGTCLEIGIGTGRIAVPLMQRGVDVVGVDISMEMLRRLRAKQAAASIALADATRLPFRDRTFTSTVAAHVLHLVPAWKSAVDELMRVTVPGGVLLAARGASSKAEWNLAVRRHFFVEAGDPPWPPGMDRIESLDEEMRSRGASVEVLEDVRNEVQTSIGELIGLLEKGIWSACWSIDEETRRRAAAATRAWAEQEFGDLDVRRADEVAADWRAYRLPE